MPNAQYRSVNLFAAHGPGGFRVTIEFSNDKPSAMDHERRGQRIGSPLLLRAYFACMYRCVRCRQVVWQRAALGSVCEWCRA